MQISETPTKRIITDHQTTHAPYYTTQEKPRYNAKALTTSWESELELGNLFSAHCAVLLVASKPTHKGWKKQPTSKLRGRILRITPHTKHHFEYTSFRINHKRAQSRKHEARCVPTR